MTPTERAGHTKGPWEVDGFGRRIKTADNETVALAYNQEDGWLIAAAPDLLAAVQALMEQKTMSPLKMTPDERRALWAAHDLARAAIQKATQTP